MEKFFYSSYASAMDALVDKISSLEVDLSRPKIIVVPEIYSFLAERAFYSLGKGSFDVRVCSFTKLYYEWCEQNEALGRQGAIALIRKILSDCKDELKYYKRSYDKRGFAGKVYETVEKLISGAIDPDSLTSDKESEANKLYDVRLILRRYAEATFGRFVDATGRINALTQYVINNGDKVKNYKFYFANFDVFSKAQRLLIDALDGVGAEVQLYQANLAVGYGAPKNTVVYSASSDVDQLKRVAIEIKNKVVDGARYGDIAVLGENISYETLKRIFDENGIPFHSDRNRPLDQDEVGRLIVCLVECVGEGLRKEKMIALARNSLVLTKQESDEFIRYVSVFMVNFGGFRQEFEKCEEGREKLLPFAESARKKLLNLVDLIYLPTKCTAQLMADKAIKVLKSVSVDKESERMAELAQSTLIMLKQVFGAGEYPLKELLGALKEAFAGVGVSDIPNESDVVYVGALNSRRGFRSKHLFIVSFNDGVLPKTSDLPDLIGEEISDALKNKGVIIEPRTDEMNERFRDEVMQAVLGADNLFISYILDGSNKKSYLLSLIERANRIEERNSDYYEGQAEAGSPEDRARLTPTLSACLERALIGNAGVLTDSAFSAVSKQISDLDAPSCDTVSKLDGKVEVKTTSVSKIQCYLGCPRKYFFQYVIKARKTLTGEVDSLDVGNVLHKIVELFAAEMEGAEDEKALAKSITDKVFSEFDKAFIASNERMINRLKTEAVNLCITAKKQVDKGSFKVLAAELEYNDVTLTQEDGQIVTIVGKIDRVDACGDKVRVIDYKTGKKVGLTFKELYYGDKIQLPVYAKAMENKGYECVGTFYFPVSKSSDGRLTGFYVSEDDVIYAMDNLALSEDNYESDVFNFKNERKVDGERKIKTYMLTGEQMQNVVTYALRLAGKAVEQIRDGNIIASPTLDGQSSTCKYCDYAWACKSDVPARKRGGTINYDTIREALD